MAANRFLCSTEQFPQNVSERARKRTWHEFIEEHYTNFEMSFAEDRRLFARLEAARFGSVLVDSGQATLPAAPVPRGTWPPTATTIFASN